MTSSQIDRLRGNFRKIQLINFFTMFLVVMPIVVPYWQSHGLDMHGIYLLQTIFAVCIVVLEVPSGYLSDHLGRKRTLHLAGLFSGAAFTTLAFADSFVWFVCFEVLAALGASLFSGTDVAMIYDTAEAIEAEAEAEAGGGPGNGTKEPAAASVLGHRLFYSQSGETVAALLGGALAMVSLSLPAMVNAGTAWIPFLISLTLVEPPRRLLGKKSHTEKFRHIGDLLFRQSPLVRLILLNLIAYGLATLIAVWAFQGHWRALEIPLVHFGWLWAAYNLVVALVGRVAHRIEGRVGSVRVLIAIGLLPVIGYFGMALSGAILGVVFGLAFQVSRGMTQVVLKDALNTRVPTDYRATANSVSSLGVRACFALLGPLMGWTIDRSGYSTAFLGFGVLFLLAFFVLCLPLVARRAEFKSS